MKRLQFSLGNLLLLMTIVAMIRFMGLDDRLVTELQSAEGASGISAGLLEMPVGIRRAVSAVRNAQLRLARQQERLKRMEQEANQDPKRSLRLWTNENRSVAPAAKNPGPNGFTVPLGHLALIIASGGTSREPERGLAPPVSLREFGGFFGGAAKKETQTGRNPYWFG